jgi:hypothetical protein
MQQNPNLDKEEEEAIAYQVKLKQNRSPSAFIKV